MLQIIYTITLFPEQNFDRIYSDYRNEFYPGKELKEVKKEFLRFRDEITRSRISNVGDTFDKDNEKNQEIIRFAQATGLRRNEMEHIVPSFIKIQEDGKVIIELPSNAESKEKNLPSSGTKGGRGRKIEILPQNVDFIKSYISDSKEPIFGKVNSHMDIHSCRAIYANQLLELHSRNLDELEHKRCFVSNNHITLEYDASRGAPRRPFAGECDLPLIYTCKGSLNGETDSFYGRKYDRVALIEVAHSLGHQHYATVVSNYVRT